MSEERGARWQLYPPLPNELYTYVVESRCGDTDDSQDVEFYDGTLGVTTDFVAAHQSMVGQVQWNDNLAQSLGVWYSNFGNVSGVRWGSGTLVSDNLFLTAGHLFDRTVPPGSGWVLPGGGPRGNVIISSEQIARNMHVNFNFQFDENGNLRQEQRFAIVELVEYRPGGLDIAVVRLAGTPRPAFGVGVIATGNPPVNDPICIIGHPLGVPKRIEAGSIAGYAGNTIQYNDIDTLGGNSGSPIWHSPSGTIVGVHTNGGCDDPSAGFFNSGVAIASALRVSPTVQSLTLHAPPILAEHSLKALDVVRLSRDNGASIEQWMYWGGPNQRFRPEPLGDGTFRFVADHSGKVLDIRRNSHANGAPLHQWEWHGGSNQRFRLEPVGRGYRRIVGQHSGKVVDVAHSSRDSGVEIHQWDGHGGPNQRFRLLTGPIFAQHSGKALDIIGFSRSDKAPLIQWAYHGDVNQIFRFEPLGDGTYRIVADHSGKVLDIEGFSQQNGARVMQFEWHGGPNQRFRVDAVGGGFYRIIAVHSGKVLDVFDISRENGAQIVQWDWNGGPNQRFRLFSAPLIALHSGRAMDVQNQSLDNKAAVIQWDSWGGQNQRFYPERLADGTYRFVADHCRKVLDIEGSSQHNGARVIQFEWHGGPNQRFRLEPNVTAGEYRIVAVHSGKVLDVQGISTANGANVHQWDWVGGFNQLWRFG